jgi:xanthine dehydrogenase accessory factor
VSAGRTAVVVATLSGPPRRLVVSESGRTTGTLGDRALDEAAGREARSLLAGGVSGVREVASGDGRRRIYFERHAPPLTLVVFGATHVAMPLVALGGVLGLRTVVVDGRDRFATRERFPARTKSSWHAVGARRANAVRQETLVVLLARLQVRPSGAAGGAGERCGVCRRPREPRGPGAVDFLAGEGVPAEQLARVRIPVGLDLGGNSPEEIALSVLSEAVAVYHGRSGGPMRDRPATP